MKKRKISDAVVRRLPRYYRYLDDLHSKGIVRISSSLLGERMGITASQIRQDLSCFGEFGQQGYGYNILELRTEIGHILGVDEQHRLVVVGAGHLGHALLRNFDFMQTGFLLDTAFDVSPTLIGTRVNNVLIRSFDEIGDYFAACHPDVAVLTVPKHIAQEVAEQLVALGVRGIWNFTNTELHVGSDGARHRGHGRRGRQQRPADLAQLSANNVYHQGDFVHRRRPRQGRSGGVCKG